MAWHKSVVFRLEASWLFEPSPMRGDIENELDIVLAKLSEFMS